MKKTQKSTTLYSHPFSKAYWLDALAEFKDTKMLVFAALIIALRVVLKLVAIPLAPNLKINTSFLANALGAMVYGPVVAIPAAIISDVLGVMITGDTYFVPFVLTEIASSLIFSLFLYRAKPSTLRVMLSRFSICIIVNVLIQTPIMMLYYQIMLGGKTYTWAMAIPGMIKNLFMFPIESLVLTLFLDAMLPLTNKARLTYSAEKSLQFSKKQIVALVSLFVVGCVCVVMYLNYHYEHTSLTTAYTMEERVEMNHRMDEILEEQNKTPDDNTVSVIESAYKPFMKHDVTYNVAYYAITGDLDEAAREELWQLKKTKARKNEDLTLMGNAVILVNEKTGELLDFQYTPAE